MLSRVCHCLGRWRYVLFGMFLIKILFVIRWSFKEDWRNNEKVEWLLSPPNNPHYFRDEAWGEVNRRSAEEQYWITFRRDLTRFQRDFTTVPDGACNPIQNIMFLKVHKCHSSLLSSIFLRYAIKHNLNVALPSRDFGHIGWPQPIEKLHVFLHKEINKANLELNIVAHHTTYNRDTVRLMMPNGTRLVAILRWPLAQLQSSLNFFRVAPGLGLTDRDVISAFLNNAEELEKRMHFRFKGKYYGNRSITKNFMSTEFGLSDESLQNKSKIAAFIKEVHEDFHLVMIKEYMYESLVLLRRVLCWDLGDLLFSDLNRRSYKLEFNDDVSLLQKHEVWSRVDYALYEHFNKTLWVRIAKEGSSFKSEVDILKDMNGRVNRLCYDDGNNGSFVDIKESQWNKAFAFKLHDCKDLSRTPEDWTPLLRSRLVEKLGLLLQNTSSSNS